MDASDSSIFHPRLMELKELAKDLVSSFCVVHQSNHATAVYMYMYLHFFQLDARFKKPFYRNSLRVQKKKILRSLTLARKYRYLCTNIHQCGILETTIILSWFTAVIKLMIVLSWSLNGRCSWKRSIYIQKKNSKILFACMCSWFFSMSELGFFLAITAHVVL